MTQQFDFEQEFENGLYLIEASAGTGKTYTIAGLSVAQILRGVKINQILLVTFTKSATEELRLRVRNALVDALKLLRGEIIPTVWTPLQQIFKEFVQNKEKINLFVQALRNFDEAQIFTIHGFCNYILNNYSFETGNTFEMDFCETLETQHEIFVYKWLRKNLGNETKSFFVELEFEEIKVEQVFLDFAQQLEKFPQLALEPSILEMPIIDNTDIDLNFNKLKSIWDFENIYEVLKNADINRTSYKLSAVQNDLSEIEQWLYHNAVKPKNLYKYAQSQLDSKINKTGKNFPEHIFFETLEIYLKFLENYKKSLKIKLNFYICKFEKDFKNEFNTQSKQENKFTFNDLINSTYKYLYHNKDKDIINTINSAYKCVLIDEFQDTDEVQYNIFNSLFNTPKHLLFMIGDPKQSIYKFRGADIDTYLQVMNMPNINKNTLNINWRSEKNLVHAINKIFSKTKNPFIIPELKFQPVQAFNDKTILENGQTTSPFKILFADNFENIDELRKILMQQTAEEIIRLLKTDCKIWDEDSAKYRSVRANDITILVRSNTEIKNMQEILSHLGLSSAMRTKNSILQTEEAQKILHILQSVLYSPNQAYLKATLALPLCGLIDNPNFAQQLNQPEFLDLWAERFTIYKDLFCTHGIMSFFSYFSTQINLRENIIKYKNGERQLTNFLHLIEILLEQQKKNQLTAKQLVNFLEQSIFNCVGNDENMLRMDSEDNLIRIETIHRSKGMEYNIVFCPCLSAKGKKQYYKYIVEAYIDKKHALYINPENNQLLQNNIKEAVAAENTRLLYVALTRAKYRCYAGIWPTKNNVSSILNQVLSDVESKNFDENIFKIKKILSELENPSEIEIINCQLCENTTKYIEQNKILNLQLPKIKIEIPQKNFISSFSKIINNPMNKEFLYL